MADAVISVVAERVAAVIADQICYQVNLVRGVEKEVLHLSKKLETIKDVLDDAEKRGVIEQSVKKWLKKLEDAAYEMDDVLDEWNYALLKHNMETVSFPSYCLCFKKVSVHHQIGKKIQNIKATIDQILMEKDDFKFAQSLRITDHVHKPLRVQSTSSIELGKVHGVDIRRNKNDIVRKLMVNGDTEIVSIVGMGGLGKTTLAQLVYNDTQVRKCFEMRIWICVSDPFDLGGIARAIVESITKETFHPNTTNRLELVLEKLRDCILGKKILLVLDDVWTENSDEWEPLNINLKNGAVGSKILVTTRKEGVAKMMGSLDQHIYHPQQLTDEECWIMLRRISLLERSEEECREFKYVGKKIAKKCKGLPLAAKVLGSLLQSKKSLEEWENVLESEIWRLEKAEVDLFPHLLLSYNELSPALKRCFSYCAVYPKDYEINVESLVEEWRALDYLGCVGGNGGGVEVKGRDYFNNLAMRSLFQDFKKKRDDSIEWCKMHDIVHDFAKFLRKNNNRVEGTEMTKRSCQVCSPLLVSEAKEYRSLVWGKESTRNLCDCLISLRVLRCGRLPNGTPRGLEKLIHLRWLKLSRTTLSKEDLKIICRLYFLQTLLLAYCSLKEIPSEIGNLVHLRHLDLSRNEEVKELPNSMCSLVELQILNLDRCSNLNRLPEGIHMLQNLRHLLTVDTLASHHFPRGIAQLSGLRRLSTEFFGGSGWNKLALLKNLNRLTGSLELVIPISNINDLEELVEDAKEADLRNKIHIQTLKIHFEANEERRSSSLWMDVIEALEPNQNLKKLDISGYDGSRLPHWISSPHYLIKEIRLCNLGEVSSLPAMGKLPFLEVLYLQNLKELKLVGREFVTTACSSSSSSSSTSNIDVGVAFPKLKDLTFYDCNNWEEWEDITAEEEESANVAIMPCLAQLRIYCCRGLKKLPHRLLRKASSSLQILDIEFLPELETSYNPQLQHR